MKLLQSLAAGLAGAVGLTATHQLLHHISDDAPRMDLMGEEGLMKLSGSAGMDIPAEDVYNTTMALDIASNTLFYALAGIGNRKNVIARGTILGLAAGTGAVYLPRHIKLTNTYSDRTLTTKLLTVGIYTLGGFVTGLLLRNK